MHEDSSPSTREASTVAQGRIDDSDAVEADASSDEAKRPRRRRAHIAWIVVSSLLFSGLVATIAVIDHLIDVNDQWQQRADDLAEIGYELGDDLVAEEEVVLAQEARIELLNKQLSTLQQSLLDLAEVANRSEDNVVTASQQIDELNDLISTGASVANSLNRCIESQEQLAEYLVDAEDYEPEELEAFEASVDKLCSGAIAANVQFQQSLT